MKIGQVFIKNGITYCVLEKIVFDNKEYLLISEEKDKLDFNIYEQIVNSNGCSLNLVKDTNILFSIYDMIGGNNEK